MGQENKNYIPFYSGNTYLARLKDKLWFLLLG